MYKIEELHSFLDPEAAVNNTSCQKLFYNSFELFALVLLLLFLFHGFMGRQNVNWRLRGLYINYRSPQPIKCLKPWFTGMYCI
jgi:hypothetical protein